PSPPARVIVGGQAIGLFRTDAHQSCPHFGGLAGPRLARVHHPSRPHASDIHGLVGHPRHLVGALVGKGPLRVFRFALGLSVLNQIEAHHRDPTPSTGLHSERSLATTVHAEVHRRRNGNPHHLPRLANP